MQLIIIMHAHNTFLSVVILASGIQLQTPKRKNTRWSNLKVPVIARKLEACILRCKWLVHLNPKAELTNEKEKLPCK